MFALEHAAEVVDGEIGVRAEFNAFAKVVQEAIVELVEGDAQRQPQNDRDGAVQQHPAAADDGLGQPFDAEPAAAGARLDAHRQHAHHRGQEQHRQDEGDAHAGGRDVAQMTKRRRIAEVHAEKADGGGQAGQKNRLQVDAQAFDDGRAFLAPLTHFVQHGDQQVNAVRHRQRHDHGGGLRRGGRHAGAHPAGQTHGRGGRKSDDEQGAKGAGQRAQQPEHDDEHGQVHERHQGLHVLQARLGEGVVEHGQAGEIDLDVGIRGADVVGQAPGVGGHFRHLGDAFAGKVQRDVDAGHVRRRRNEAVDQ